MFDSGYYCVFGIKYLVLLIVCLDLMFDSR